MDKKHELVTICGVRGFIDENGVAQLNAEDVARGWGFTQIAKSGNEVVRWERVNKYLTEFGFVPTSGDGVAKDDFLPENMVYRLGFKASNEAAQVFQAKLADEILPTIRKTGSYNAKPMTQLDILVESAKALQTHERELARLRLDNEEIRKEQKIQASRIDTLNGVCTEGTKRQKLVSMIAAYATKNGLAFSEAWRRFKRAYNTAFRTNVSLMIKKYAEKRGLKKEPTLPEFLELRDLLDDALRIADKMLNTPVVTA